MLNVQGLAATAATVRGIAIDAVEESGTGHPGMPMGTADVGSVVFGELLKHYPKNPDWIDRDRFVLSAGHGSILLYALLHLSGYDLPYDDLKRLRRLGSKTPGHPEYGITEGVETTTGPLGAGFATAVGMAIAETRLAEEFNTEEHTIIDHATIVLSGDGCLMEGVASEAASLAGHLQLGKLIVLYDSNNVSIEGKTEITFTEDVHTRFRAYGWQTLKGNAYDVAGIVRLVEEGRRNSCQPTLIELDSVIGYGSPGLAGSHKVHGSLLGAEEIAATKKAIGLPPDEAFHILPEAKAYMEESQRRLKAAYDSWNTRFAEWSKKNPELRARLDRYIASDFTELDGVDFPTYSVGTARSTRDVSGEVIQALAKQLPNFLGGSADLSHSNKTEMPGHGEYGPTDRLGQTIRYGVREHAMASIQNGLILHGGVRSFAATLFVFIDYMRPALRLAALMKLPAVYVLTHDSIYLGGDGPTHQPVEHLAALRIIPNMTVLRPADPEETVESWKIALEHTTGPTSLVLSRQALTTFEKSDPHWRLNVRDRGAYVVREGTAHPDVTILATGSEVEMALTVAEKLNGTLNVRVVSVLSRERLAIVEGEHLSELVGGETPVVVVEAATPFGWERFTRGRVDRILGIDRFGESGRGEEVAEYLGFTTDALEAMVIAASEEGGGVG